jgi:pSer/pThr/pTyr-binding forkhead associated (FHA) protein
MLTSHSRRRRLAMLQGKADFTGDDILLLQLAEEHVHTPEEPSSSQEHPGAEGRYPESSSLVVVPKPSLGPPPEERSRGESVVIRSPRRAHPDELHSVEEEFSRCCGVPSGLRLLVESRGRPAESFHSKSPLALIGHDPRCQLRLEEQSADAKHAVILALSGQYLVCDLGSQSGTWHGGQRIQAEWLPPGEAIRCGDAEIQLESEFTQSDAAASVFEDDQDSGAATFLRFPRRRERDVIYPVKRRAVLFGRDPRCKIQLTSRSVSRFHAMLVRTHSGVWVVDLTSREGTWLNGNRVMCAPVAEGAEIRFGRVRAQVEADPDDSSLAVPGDSSHVAGGLSEDFVRELISQFRASQEQTLAEMRRCMAEVVQSLMQQPALPPSTGDQAADAYDIGKDTPARRTGKEPSRE